MNFFTFIYLSTYLFVSLVCVICAWQGTHAEEVRGEPVESRVFWGSNSGHQAGDAYFHPLSHLTGCENNF